MKGSDLGLPRPMHPETIRSPTFLWPKCPTDHVASLVAESEKMKPMRFVSFSFVSIVLLSLIGCRSPYYADLGAALGGVAGGLAGAALGDHSGNAVGGALLGSAVGAVTGAAVGDSMDAEVDRRQAIAETRRRLANAVSPADVTAMSASGLGENVIINHIRANGVKSSLTPGQIIELHENGVSEKVINAMQREGSRQAGPPVVVNGPPVIIEESYIVPPYCGPPPYRHHFRPPPHYRRRPGVSWGVSYSR